LRAHLEDGRPLAAIARTARFSGNRFDDWNFDQLAPSLWQFFSSTVLRLLYQPGQPLVP
jgi:hypothetical protein